MAIIAFLFSAAITFAATWLFCESLSRFLNYWSRRISVGTLYLQWERDA